jgi:beta-glucanase (GH16 family)
MIKLIALITTFCLIFNHASAQCTSTLTTVSGTKAPTNICSGDLIFEDNFDTLDHKKWRHELSLGGGGNWEFQWYVNDRFNSYTAGGFLHLKPSYTSTLFGEDFLSNGRVIIPPSECTQPEWFGCDRRGSDQDILNPIRSARMDTWDSFHFKFGTVEIRAKIPSGDWIWPALWLMPRQETYGGWPRSGEIDLMESKGNRNLFDGETNVGAELSGSTLHFGASGGMNGYPTAHYEQHRSPAWSDAFHLYKLVWTPDYLEFYYDNVSIGRVSAGEGFWKRGGWENSGVENPWKDASIMAPFDQEFFIIMNVAVGGTNGYFSDASVNRGGGPKPW